MKRKSGPGKVPAEQVLKDIVLGLARNAWFYWVSAIGVAIPPSLP